MKGSYLKSFFVSVISFSLVLTSLQAFAAPPHPELRKKIRAGVRSEPAYMKHMKKAGPQKQRGRRGVIRQLKKRGLLPEGDSRISPAPGAALSPESLTGSGEGLVAAAAPSTGTLNVLVLLVSFADEAPQDSPLFFNDLVFGPSAPTVADYYWEVSDGALDLTTLDLPSTVGWLSLQGNKAFYNTPVNGDLRDMALDAVTLADPLVDFSNYDNDGDGKVDFLVLVHTGSGGELTGSDDDIWSRTVSLSTEIPGLDGVAVDTFMTVPEYWVDPAPSLPAPIEDMTIGVYAHEFGHLLGLVDLYDLGLDSSGIGDWGLMGLGAWNGPGNMAWSPAYPSAWSRVALGWDAPFIPTDNIPAVTLPPVDTPGVANNGPVYYLWNEGMSHHEFFLIENRQQTGYDSYLPSHGLLVWHVDETMADNENPALSHNDCEWDPHYMVALQQADGLLNLENDPSLPLGNQGDLADPYPGFGNTEFSLSTTPNSGSYADCLSQVAVLNIQEVGVDITADLQVRAPTALQVADYDTSSALLPGATVPMTVSLSNGGATATGVTAHLSSLNPLITVTKPGAGYPAIPFAEMVSNGADPFEVTVDPLLPTGTLVDFAIQISADGGYLETRIFPVVVEPADVLLVDDDRNDPADYSSYLLDPIAALGRGVSHWDYLVRGVPPLSFMDRFPVALWTTAATFNSTVTPADEDLLSAYLLGGGSLILSSQDYYFDRGLTPFAKDYLQAVAFLGEWGYSGVLGSGTDPLFNGLGPYALVFPPSFPNRVDLVFPNAMALTSFKDTGDSLDSAIRYDGPDYRSAFFGFPLEALAGPDRTAVLDILLDWMNPLTDPDLQFVQYEALSPLLPGSTVPLTVTLGNSGGVALGISAHLVSLDPLVTVTDPAAPYPPIAQGETSVNDVPFTLDIDPSMPLGSLADLVLEVTADGGYSADLSLQVMIGVNERNEHLLLVRRDGAGGDNIMVAEWLDNMLLNPVDRGALAGGDGIFLRGDVNGDGLRDLVRGQIPKPDRVEWSVHLAYPSESGIFYEESPSGVWNADLGSQQSLFFLADTDGDGLEDLVFTERVESAHQGAGVFVALSDGDSFGDPGQWSSVPALSQLRGLFVGDVDGDGWADLVRGEDSPFSERILDWRVALSDGSSFLPWEGWGETPARPLSLFLLGDVDGDGRDDILSSVPPSGSRKFLDWEAALSGGDFFLAGTPWLEGFGRWWESFALSDIDGDGLFDLLGWNRQGGDWTFEAALSEGGSSSDLGEVGTFGARSGDVLLP